MKGCRAQKSWHAGRELLTEHRTLQSMLRWSLLCVFSWVGAITDVCLCRQVAYLLVYGELPSSKELARWDEALMRHSAVPDAVERAVAALPHDAHFMGIVLVALNALSTVHPEQNPALAGQNIYKSKEMQDKQIVRLIGERPQQACKCSCSAHVRKPRPCRSPHAGHAALHHAPCSFIDTFSQSVQATSLLACRQDAGNCSYGVPQSQRAQLQPAQPAPIILRKLPVHA